MATTQEVTHSTRENSAGNPVWMDGLRIFLGLFLFLKGSLFLQHISEVFYIFSSEQEVFTAGNAHMLTSVVHIVGGIMIATGTLTRLALLCQFPILMGALLFVNLQQGLSFQNTELILSVIALGLLLFLMIVGPGRYSVDNKLLRQKKGETKNAHK